MSAPVAGLLLLLLPAGLVAQAEPPNAPAIVTRTSDHVRLTYDGVSIFDGVIRADSAAIELRTLTDTAGGVVTQILKWTVRNARGREQGGRGRAVRSVPD